MVAQVRVERTISVFQTDVLPFGYSLCVSKSVGKRGYFIFSFPLVAPGAVGVPLT